MGRRNKISPDPRGKFWSEDSSKFGQQILEKMGWSKGKGLGRNEDGQVEHIKTRHKIDKKGVGYTVDHDNNWLAHQEDFNSLLMSLQEHHSTVSNTNELQSLEECSKKSRNRVHYSKFTRGKDLSRYSQEDMACIIVSSKVDQDESVDEKSSHNTNTFTAAYNMKEYFAEKLGRLKSSSGANKEDLDSVKENSCDVDKTSSSKRIKNKVEHLNDDCKVTHEHSKKKKRKHKTKNLIEDEQLAPINEMDECGDEKQKRKKHKKICLDESELIKNNTLESQLNGGEYIKKKRKHQEKAFIENQVPLAPISEVDVCGNEKQKHNFLDESEFIENTTSESPFKDAEYKKKRKKSKKKKKPVENELQ